MKESKSEPTVATVRKGRAKAETKVTSTPKPPKKPRVARKIDKSIEKLEEKEKEVKSTPVLTPPVEEKSKINAEELKNELLADWMDEDEIVTTEKEKTENGKKINEHFNHLKLFL
jgi:hypothetical protein